MCPASDFTTQQWADAAAVANRKMRRRLMLAATQEFSDGDHTRSSDVLVDSVVSIDVKKWELPLPALLEWMRPSVHQRCTALGLANGFDENWARVARELASCLLGDTLAEAHRVIFCTRLVGMPHTGLTELQSPWLALLRAAGVYNGDGVVQEGAVGDAAAMRFHADVERLASFDGHPLHPMAKTRLPASVEDLLRNAPELTDTTTVPVAAVHRSVAIVSGQPTSPRSARDLFWRNFAPSQRAIWEHSLEEAGASAAEFVPVPVHPLNVSRVAQLFERHIDAGLLRLLPLALDKSAETSTANASPSFEGRPTMSMRTVEVCADQSCAATNGRGVHVKLPMAVQITSLERYLSPVEVMDSPLLAAALRKILIDHQYLNQSLYMLDEHWGVTLHHTNEKTGTVYGGSYAESPPPVPPVSYADARFLACLLREHPCGARAMLQAPTVVVPLAAMFTCVAAEPLVVDLMKHGGSEVRTHHDAAAYYALWAKTVVKAQVGFFVRFGVCIEAHQQNALVGLCVKSGMLKYLVYREMAGGLYNYEPVLKDAVEAAGHTVENCFHERHDSLYDSPEVPASVLVHSMLASHLVPLAQLVCEFFPGAATDSGKLLGAVRTAFKEEVAAALAEAASWPAERRARHASFVAEVSDAVLERPWRSKLLLTMRCANTRAELFGDRPNLFASSACSSG